MITTKVLIAPKIAENSQTTQYTASNCKTIIDKFIATNYSGGTVTFSINLVTVSDTAGNQNLQVKLKSIAPSETYTFPEIVGRVLEAGGFISTVAGTATALSIACNGREIT
jgi:hypothetical protein